MKRRILSIVVVLVLVLTAMTSVAWAVPSFLVVSGTQITGDGVWVNDGNGGITTNGANAGNYNVKYNQASGELTLKDAVITSDSSDGIYAGYGDLTIILEGKNTITTGHAHGMQISSDVILTIKGSGSLTVESTTATDFSPGILINDGTLKVEDVSVKVISNGNGICAGVQAMNIIVENGSLTGISRSNDTSLGVWGSRSIRIINGSLTGISNDTATTSFGIFTNNILTIDNNSTIVGQGKNAISATSYNLGNTSAWYGDNAQAAFTAGPQSVPTNFTDVNYAVIGTPYTLTTGDGITVSPTASGNQYPVGMGITVTAPETSNGKAFEKWESSNGGTFENVNAFTTTFTMPAGDTTLTTVYESDETGSPGNPTNPGTSTTPASGKTETKSNTSPATGDDLNLGIYVVIMVLAGFAGTAVVWKRKKS